MSASIVIAVLRSDRGLWPLTREQSWAASLAVGRSSSAASSLFTPMITTKTKNKRAINISEEDAG